MLEVRLGPPGQRQVLSGMRRERVRRRSRTRPRRWYLSWSVTATFVGMSSPSSRASRASSLMSASKNRQFKITKEDVRNTSGLYSPLMQTYLAYLYAKRAKTWPSGRSLKEVLHDGLVNDPLGVHHIFPKEFMQSRDFPIDRLNTVANYAILSQADNAELSDRNPFDAWRELKPNQREYASAQLCFVASEDKLRPEWLTNTADCGGSRARWPRRALCWRDLQLVHRGL
jgi:hypothetical protein